MKDIMKENYMFDTENITSVSKNMIVVCYDISDNKRRNQMVSYWSVICFVSSVLYLKRC